MIEIIIVDDELTRKGVKSISRQASYPLLIDEPDYNPVGTPNESSEDEDTRSEEKHHSDSQEKDSKRGSQTC